MKTNEEMNAMNKDAESLNQKICSLNEEESVQVTGGRKGDCVTKMFCPCGYSTSWFGYFVGDVFDCPKCGEHTLKGERKA